MVNYHTIQNAIKTVLTNSLGITNIPINIEPVSVLPELTPCINIYLDRAERQHRTIGSSPDLVKSIFLVECLQLHMEDFSVACQSRDALLDKTEDTLALDRTFGSNVLMSTITGVEFVNGRDGNWMFSSALLTLETEVRD